MDFNIFKAQIKARLDLWDERVLLPERHPDMKLRRRGPSLEVRFRDRFYVFPEAEVVLLPINNTSVENLSRLLAEDLYQSFRKHGVETLTVFVEETAGQGASTQMP